MKKALLLIALFATGNAFLSAQNLIMIEFKYSRVTVETTQTADGKI